jgi:trk system potassium uptake protein TrkH
MESGKKVSFINKLAPVQVLVLSFAVVILVGTILLMLPVSSADGHSTPFLTSFFTSTSAVCVTGLVVVDTGTYWSTFGQVVIISLIQVGGLGLMSFATLIAFVLGKKITLRERLVMQEAMNSFSIQGLVRLMKYVLLGTLIIEGTGALLLAVKFIPAYGFGKGLFFSIFHSVSAYCNAGFDLIGEFRSLIPFQSSAIVNFTIMGLIVIGGIGFLVQLEVFQYRSYRKLSLHSKTVLVTTFLLITAGALIFFVLEYNNPGTMKNMPLKDKGMASLFMSVTPRTAGYNTIPLDQMTMPSKLVTIILMFIGASPGSTGGGIKTTTYALLIMAIIAVVRGRSDTELMGKRIPNDIVLRALSIAAISLTLVIVDVFVLSITEHGAGLVDIIYESTSAFGTVGLSVGLTTKLTSIGRVIISLTMFAGRVGPLTLALAFAQKQFKNTNSIKYPEDKILVG